MAAEAVSLELDPQRRTLRGPTGEEALSPLGWRLIQILRHSGGQVVDRARLIDELWAGNHLVGEPALNRLVSETRRALRGALGRNVIETVQRSGYRWIAPEPVAPAPKPPRWQTRYLPWVLGFLATTALLGVVGWIVEEAMGVIWVAQHGG